MLTIIGAIGIAVLVLNLVLYFMRYFGKNKAYRFFVLYLLAIGIIDLLVFVYAHKDLNNHFLSSYYLFFRFVFLSCFFCQLFLPVNKKASLGVKCTSIIILIGLVAQYVVDPQLYFTFNSAGFLITGSALMMFAALYLYEQLSKKLPFYYVNIGLFLYLGSSSLIFISATSIVSFDKEINMLIWKTNALLFIVYQLLILWEWKQNFLQKAMK